MAIQTPRRSPGTGWARRALRILALLAGLGALAILFAWFGVDELREAIFRLEPAHLGAYLAVACLVRLGYSLRWRLVARTFGSAHAQPWPRFAAARLAGDAASAFIPTGKVGGDPVRIILLYGRGVGGSEASASVALDRIMELIGNTICAVTYVTVFSVTRALPASETSLSFGTATFVVLLALLAAPLVLCRLGIRPLSPAMPQRWLQNRPRLKHWLDLVRRVEDDLIAFVRQRPLTLFGGIAGSLLIEALVVAQYSFLLLAFGIRIDLPIVLIMLVTVGVSRAVPVPGGLGALEVGQVTLLAAVLGDASLGFLVGFVMRLHETFWVVVGLGALSHQGFSLTRLRRAVEADAAPGEAAPALDAGGGTA